MKKLIMPLLLLASLFQATAVVARPSFFSRPIARPIIVNVPKAPVSKARPARTVPPVLAPSKPVVKDCDPRTGECD